MKCGSEARNAAATKASGGSAVKEVVVKQEMRQ